VWNVCRGLLSSSSTRLQLPLNLQDERLQLMHRERRFVDYKVSLGEFAKSNF